MVVEYILTCEQTTRRDTDTRHPPGVVHAFRLSALRTAGCCVEELRDEIDGTRGIRVGLTTNEFACFEPKNANAPEKASVTCLRYATPSTDYAGTLLRPVGTCCRCVCMLGFMSIYSGCSRM
jgi:hypothetical protein